MYRVWWFVAEWLLLLWCVILSLWKWLCDVGFSSCANVVMFVCFMMSIFKRVLSWPWKKILTVVVKVASWVLEKLPADPPKSPKG